MSDSVRLKHLAFFEEIASLKDEDPSVSSASATLVVLRLIDAWLDEGPQVLCADSWGVRNARGSVEAIDEGSPLRSLLLRVLDTLTETQHPRAVMTPLMAFAQALEYDAKWRLAADVYHSVLSHLHPAEDADLSIAAHLRLGQCYRTLNDIESAAEAFSSASEIAQSVGDLVGVLRARIGEARIAMIHGNLPCAEALLDDTIRQAVGESMQDVRSRALHDRANVAHFREQYELAIQLAYQAHELSQTPTERDRILGDIAVSFLELGVYSAARDAYMVLSATAQEQYTRWAATLNLLEIAALTGGETVFELYRRELADHELPPYMATAFELNQGTGFSRFGDQARARRHLERALALAEQHGFNQYLFQIENAMLGLQQTTRSSVEFPEPLSLNTEEVATAIRSLRKMAGV